MIKIVYACNDGYIDGLCLSILSIVKRTKESIGFYVLTADYTEYKSSFIPLSAKKTDILNRLVKKYNPESFVETIDCTKIAKQQLTNQKNLRKKKFSPYACLRLLINHFPQFSNKLLYLDCDIMASGDIKELFDIDLMDNEMAVCHNWWARHFLKKNSFNSGVILFNLNKTKQTKLFEKSVEWFNKKNFMWPDQSALYLSATKYMFFPGDEYRFNYQNNTIQPNTVLKHFCACPHHWPLHYNIKQWQVDDVHKYLKIHVFDEDFKEWSIIRNEWK